LSQNDDIVIEYRHRTKANASLYRTTTRFFRVQKEKDVLLRLAV